MNDEDTQDEFDEQLPDDGGAVAIVDEPDSRSKAAREARRLKREAEEVKQFWRNALTTEQGRRAIWQLLRAGGWPEWPFACGPNGFPQPEATWFQNGARDLAQRLYEMWDVLDHQGVYLMRCEHDPRYVNAEPT